MSRGPVRGGPGRATVLSWTSVTRGLPAGTSLSGGRLVGQARPDCRSGSGFALRAQRGPHAIGLFLVAPGLVNVSQQEPVLAEFARITVRTTQGETRLELARHLLGVPRTNHAPTVGAADPPLPTPRDVSGIESSQSWTSEIADALLINRCRRPVDASGLERCGPDLATVRDGLDDTLREWVRVIKGLQDREPLGPPLSI